MLGDVSIPDDYLCLFIQKDGRRRLLFFFFFKKCVFNNFSSSLCTLCVCFGMFFEEGED
jgi:hypothetical protein